MQEIHSLETSVLIDLLSDYTANYSRMLKEGSSEEDFAKCSLKLRSIQTEIDSRKRKRTNTSITDSNTNLSSEYSQ